MYRFVKITNYYKQFLNSYFAAHGNAEAGYQDGLANLLKQRFGWSDYYSRNLRTLGIDAHEIIANAEPLQKSWGREHGVEASLEEILFLQLADLKPDVVFLQDSVRFGGPWIDELRRRVPTVRLVIGWYCSPMSKTQETALKGCDVVMCCSPMFVEKLSQHGIRAHLLTHAFEPSILTEIENNPYPFVDFIFIGSILSGSGNHGLRQKVLDRLIESGVNIDIYAHIGKLGLLDLWKQRLAFLSGNSLRNIGLEQLARALPAVRKGLLLNEFPRMLKGVDAIARRANSPIYGLEMFKALAHAKMAFNYHGEIAGDYAANIRLFEVTGVGSCLVTDWKQNLGALFDIDREVVSFRSADECIEKVRWLSEHPNERAEIARRGQSRVLSAHTYAHRTALLHEIITRYLK